jgi:hypothetical protein
MSITKNAIIDFFRTNKAGLFVSIEELEQKDDEDHKMEQRVFIDQQNPESLMVNNQIGAAVANAINELPVAQATIADMFLIQEMSHEEISADLNIPINRHIESGMFTGNEGTTDDNEENFHTITSLYAQWAEDPVEAEEELWKMFEKDYPKYFENN